MSAALVLAMVFGVSLGGDALCGGSIQLNDTIALLQQHTFDSDGAASGPKPEPPSKPARAAGDVGGVPLPEGNPLPLAPQPPAGPAPGAPGVQPPEGGGEDEKKETWWEYLKPEITPRGAIECLSKAMVIFGAAYNTHEDRLSLEGCPTCPEQQFWKPNLAASAVELIAAILDGPSCTRFDCAVRPKEEEPAFVRGWKALSSRLPIASGVAGSVGSMIEIDSSYKETKFYCNTATMGTLPEGAQRELKVWGPAFSFIGRILEYWDMVWNLKNAGDKRSLSAIDPTSIITSFEGTTADIFGFLEGLAITQAEDLVGAGQERANAGKNCEAAWWKTLGSVMGIFESVTNGLACAFGEPELHNLATNSEKPDDEGEPDGDTPPDATP